jgi:hypothetical protein
MASDNSPTSMLQVAKLCAAHLPLLRKGYWLDDEVVEGEDQEAVRVRGALRDALQSFELSLCAAYRAACRARRQKSAAFSLDAWRACVRRDGTFIGWLTEACCKCALDCAEPSSDKAEGARRVDLARMHERKRNDFYKAFAQNCDLYDNADQLTLDALSALWSTVERLAWVCVNALAKVAGS